MNTNYGKVDTLLTQVHHEHLLLSVSILKMTHTLKELHSQELTYKPGGLYTANINLFIHMLSYTNTN